MHESSVFQHCAALIGCVFSLQCIHNIPQLKSYRVKHDSGISCEATASVNSTSNTHSLVQLQSSVKHLISLSNTSCFITGLNEHIPDAWQ